MGTLVALASLFGCAESHAPPDDVADVGSDADADTDADGDADADADADADGCAPVPSDCPSGEPREGSACEVWTEGECFYLSEGCQRTYACDECEWVVTRRIGC